jgi:CheY-like chemotaxis protein
MALEAGWMERHRILVVDDDRNALTALEELLVEAGYEVALAGNAAEGLRLVDSFHPEVLLTDLRMPRMSGREFAAETRGRPSPPRVVFMSVYPPPADEAAPWLSKPIDIQRMLDTLGSLVH